MTTDRNPSSSQLPDDLPQLSRALKELYAPRPETSATQDEFIRLAIYQHFKNVTVRGRWRRRIVPFAAIAALISIVCTLWMLNQPMAPPTPTNVAVNSDPMDVDRNGRIDIVDALALARLMQSNRNLDGKFDLNADGAIDSRDVDAIAMVAVSLNGGVKS